MAGCTATVALALAADDFDVACFAGTAALTVVVGAAAFDEALAFEGAADGFAAAGPGFAPGCAALLLAAEPLAFGANGLFREEGPVCT